MGAGNILQQYFIEQLPHNYKCLRCPQGTTIAKLVALVILRVIYMPTVAGMNGADRAKCTKLEVHF